MASSRIESIDDFAPDRTAQALLNLRCAVDHCHDAVFITDSTGKIEFVNPAFEALTGYSASEAMQGGFGLMFDMNLDVNADAGGNGAFAARRWKELLKQVLKNNVHHCTMRAIRKDGHRVELELAMTVVRDYRARTASIICTGRNITEETELQLEVRDARRSDTIGTIASGVAHDLNNLLMVINAYAELGLQTLYCEHPLRRNLQEIVSAARRAADLTRQMLASGRGPVPGLHEGQAELYC